MFNTLPLLLRLLNYRTDPKLRLKSRDVYICDFFFSTITLNLEAMQMIPIPLFMGEIFEKIFGELEKHMAKISEWFLHNYLKANTKMFHLLLSPFVDKAINIGNFTIKSSYPEVLLGVTTDSNLQ